VLKRIFRHTRDAATKGQRKDNCIGRAS